MSRESKNTQKPAKNIKPDTIAGYNGNGISGTILNRSRWVQFAFPGIQLPFSGNNGYNGFYHRRIAGQSLRFFFALQQDSMGHRARFRLTCRRSAVFLALLRGIIVLNLCFEKGVSLVETAAWL
jgi:hypothetical protein